jgi:hypothetical protein
MQIQAAVLRANERWSSQDAHGDFHEPVQSELADQLDKYDESINRSLKNFDAKETALAIHWAQHVLERAKHFRVLYRKEGGFSARKLSVKGHEAQRARLMDGYWDYSPLVISWWYKPLRKDRKIEPNPVKAAWAETSLKAVANSHQTVRGAAKEHGFTEGRLFNLMRDPFCQGKVKEKTEDGQLRWVKGSHPPVVEPALIEAARAAKPGRIGARKLLSEQQVSEAASLYAKGNITLDSLADRFKVSYATMERALFGFSRRKRRQSRVLTVSV